ncbi:MAG: hypothetical protein MZU97_19410 [Bacillus subtilis]|nr:hypothetical protein [Bacillus subtilis]
MNGYRLLSGFAAIREFLHRRRHRRRRRLIAIRLGLRLSSSARKPRFAYAVGTRRRPGRLTSYVETASESAADRRRQNADRS